jgi:hypothetical protein
MWRLFLVVLSIFFLTSCTPSPANQPNAPLDVEIVSLTDSQLIIKNNNTYDWTDIEIALGTPLIEPFKASYKLMESGKTYTLSLKSFWTESGEQYTRYISSRKIRYINISVDTVKGKKSKTIYVD